VATRLIDRNLVADRIEALSLIGRVGETGVTRTVYSPEWVAANDLLEQWMRDAGLTTRRDAVGNLWGVLPGSESGPSIVSGSHVDTQAPGGKYDGALGIIAALTAVEALNKTYGQPRQTLEVVSLCEEEGSRFSAASFWGSRAILGLIKPEDIEGTRGYVDESIGDAMRAIGLDPNQIPSAKRDDIDTFIELHIEQGPILEHANLPVGIVTGITGYRHFVVEVTGVANHAGAFPMAMRRDPMATAARMITELIGNAVEMGAPAVTTIGRLNVEPNYPAIIPERVTFMIDARHPDPDLRRQLYARHESTLDRFAAESGLTITYRFNKDLGPRPCDPGIVDLLDQVATDLEIPHQRMTSGAVHDTQRFSQIAKTAMIFVQSRDGRSHTPEEFTSTEHAALGIEVLAEGLHRLAYGVH
jgi:allantoate deiminase